MVPRLRPADAAALVIRVWREPGVEGFRGRVAYVVGVTRVAETVVSVDDPEMLHAAVQQWLEEFLAGSNSHAPC